MRTLTPEFLQSALKCTPQNAALYTPHIDETCARFGIDNDQRLAHFLAQIGHESGALRYSTEIWGPTPAQARYEGRADLGNTQPGDGERYKGHGLIQTTGRFNHAAARDGLRKRMADVPDFEANPQALALPRWAALSAGYYWQTHNLNELADADNLLGITTAINGGTNGLEDRRERYRRATQAIANWPKVPAAQAPQPQPEKKPMLPLIPILSAVLPSIIESIPTLGKLFGSGSDIQQRNVAAASMAVQIVQDAVGASNAQAAAEAIQASPELAQVAQKAVESRWLELTESGGGGIEGARKADLAFVDSGKRVWHSPSFWAMCMLLPLAYMVIGSVSGLWGYQAWSDAVRASLATAVVSLIIGAVSGYYMGSTTTKNKPAGETS